ncbi:O-antigen ligase family protein [Pseudohoeflea coraliihabitans]|uniref:O-antigen ligase family protein n=1 Tax=Pseudohoeflea coraliihabitans TaxID=2860393 RepID=A0ABS6WRK0_9HYPH|nr:O-antigen ligase [Pseudohoeflea sp. DP4N28-3]MBW3098601.1 O-antigen ligase family protein [Pseudohoeflea sp. DP4N28-3]
MTYPGARARPDILANYRIRRADMISPPLMRLVALTLSIAGLALILISLRPFVAISMSGDISSDGDPLKQVGFMAAGAISLAGLLTLASPRVLRSLFSPSLLALAAVIGFSVLRAPDMMETARSLGLTVIGMMITFTVVALPRGERDLRLVLASVSLLVLAISYAGVALLPHLAVHGYDAYEPQHAGLWRGLFSHKNIAGPVISVIAIFGIYLFRSGLRLIGAITFIAAYYFVIQTGSKTTSGFLPLAVFIVAMGTLTGRAWVAIALHLIAFTGALVLTLGSAFNARIFALAHSVLGDGTFTGRTSLWEFNLSMIPQRLWFGYGYDDFWLTSTVRGLDKPFWAAWDYRFIVHGHQNYLDAINNLGVIGGGIVIFVLFITPLYNYAKARRIAGNQKLADMFATIIIFLSLMGLLETFFLRRIDPIWAMQSLAIFGLHLAARFAFNPRPAGAGASGGATAR